MCVCVGGWGWDDTSIYFRNLLLLQTYILQGYKVIKIEEVRENDDNDDYDDENDDEYDFTDDDEENSATDDGDYVMLKYCS